jgi:hypothetical protein
MAFTEQILVKMGLDSTSFNSAIVSTEKRATKWAKRMKAKIAGAFALGAITAFTKRTHDFVNELGNVSDRLGISNLELSRMHAAFDATGVSIATGNMALQRFIRRVGEAQVGTGTFKDVLKEYGIALKDAEGNQRNVVDIFHDYADAIKGIKQPTERARVLMQGLDSEGVQLGQTLRFGSEGLKRFGDEAQNAGRVLDDKVVEQFQRADAAIESANRTMKIQYANILPKLIEWFLKAKLGVQALKWGFTAIGKIIVGFGIAIKEKAITALELFFDKLEQMKIKAKIAAESLNPFGDEVTLANLRKALETQNSIIEEKSKEGTKTFKEHWRDALKDMDINADKIELDKTIADTNKEIKILKFGTGEAKDEADKLKNAFQRIEPVVGNVNTELANQTTQLERQVEKVEALKKGGIKLHDAVVQRHTTEDKIAALMKSGKLSKEQAKKIIEDMVALEKEEKRILDDINGKEKTRNQIIKERGLERVQELADQRKLVLNLRLAKEAHQKQLDILQARAKGNEKLALKLEAERDLREQIKDIAEDMKIPEENAIKFLKDKLALEEKIALQKVNQLENEEAKARADKEWLLNAKKSDLNDDQIEERRKLKALNATERALEEARKFGNTREIEKLEKRLEEQRQGLFGDEIKKDAANKKKFKEEKREIKKRFKAQKDAIDAIEKKNQEIKEKIEAQKKRRDEIAKEEKALEIKHHKELIAETRKARIAAFDFIKASQENEHAKKVKPYVPNVSNNTTTNNEGDVTNNNTTNGGNNTTNITNNLEAVANGEPIIANVEVNVEKPEIRFPVIPSPVVNVNPVVALNLPKQTETIAAIENLAENLSQPINTNVALEVDTESLGKEETLGEIRDALQGKYKNE